jgi:hypothetical protein
MIEMAPNEQLDCSEFSGLQAHEERVCGFKCDVCMTPEAAETAIKQCLKSIRDRLEQAAAIAKAADTCADAGSPDKAVAIVLDVEQLPEPKSRI